MQHIDSPVPEVVPRPALELPLGTGPFIRKCLSKAPAERYSDAGAALKILDGLTEDWVPPEGPRVVAENTAPEIQALREGDTAEIGAQALRAAVMGADEAIARREQAERAEKAKAREVASASRAKAQRAAPRVAPDHGATMVAAELPSASRGPSKASRARLYGLVGGALTLVIAATALLFVFLYRTL
jgi:hypothetical protein